MRFLLAALLGVAVAAPCPPAAAQEGVRKYPTAIPVLANRSEIRALVAAEAERVLPPGDSTVTRLTLEVDAAGVPVTAVVDSSSGRPAADSAAVRIGRAMRFSSIAAQDAPMRMLIPVVIARPGRADAPEAGPQEARTLRGRLADREGEPLAGALVPLVDTGGFALRVAVPDARGVVVVHTRRQ